ncbi:MAG: NmrA/HSCARG family protein [Chitinophagaceae bacterium]|nr:NmrA/HSCARG family protein [Chitinophagaceae bacterium]
MPANKTILVAGATGNQGSAVARNLLLNGFRVKALTRNPSSPAAQKLAALNAEIVQGDLDSPASIVPHLKDVEGIFCVLAFTKGIEKEIRQGVALANLAKENEIGHYLYSSVVGADLSTGIPHWESKFKIETHIKQIGLPYTIIRPASFFDNFLIPQVRDRLLKGKLVTPVRKSKNQQYIACEDIGRISTAIFLEPGKYIGHVKTIASEQLDGQQTADVFSKVWQQNIKYQQLPGFITRLVMGGDLHKMFSWINQHGGVFIKDLPSVQKEFPGMMRLEEWVPRFFKRINSQ